MIPSDLALFNLPPDSCLEIICFNRPAYRISCGDHRPTVTYSRMQSDVGPIVAAPDRVSWS